MAETELVRDDPWTTERFPELETEKLNSELVEEDVEEDVELTAEEAGLDFG